MVIALSHTLDPKMWLHRWTVSICGCVDMNILNSVNSVMTPDGSKTYVSESGYYLNTVGLIDLNCTMDEDGSVHVDYNKTSVDYEAAQIIRRMLP